MNAVVSVENRPTILVVDDTPDNLSLMSGLLKDLYKVKIANNGERALKVVQTGPPPDLILLDIMMPVMDGYETCRHLKAAPATKDIPVIFLTAKVEVEDEMRGFELGAVDYITKPISPPVVLARVKTHLKLRKAELDLRELLVKTLGGAIGVMTDILSIASPTAFSRASRVKRHVEKLGTQMKIKGFWQIRLAAMLSQIGCVTVNPETIERIYRGEEVSREEREAFDHHPHVGYELIRKIPNLKEVAEIIARQRNLETDTGFKGNDALRNLIHTGSRVLKLALDYEQLLFAGESGATSLAMLKQRENEYGVELLEQFSRIIESESSYTPIRQLGIGELAPGMVIHRDIFTKKGELLIHAGTEINLPVYETLHNFTKTGFIQEPFEVLIPEPPSP